MIAEQSKGMMNTGPWEFPPWVIVYKYQNLPTPKLYNTWQGKFTVYMMYRAGGEGDDPGRGPEGTNHLRGALSGKPAAAAPL